MSAGDESDFPPQGTVPVYLSPETLTAFNMKLSEENDDSVQHIYLDKDVINDDINRRRFESGFFEHQEGLKNFDKVLLVKHRAPETNYLWYQGEEAIAQWTESQEAKSKADAANEGAGVMEIKEEGGEDAGEQITEPFVDKSLEPREWKDMGSGPEVKLQTVGDMRPHKVAFSVTIEQGQFGKPMEFNNRNPPDKIEEYRRQQKPNYNLNRMQLDFGAQVARAQTTAAVQTSFLATLNKTTQYEPNNFTDEEKAKILESDEMKAFLKNVMGTCKHALQQNETVDLFKQEFLQFEDEDGAVGNRSENSLKELHSFNPIKYSKGKTVSCVVWHPTREGVVAFATTNNLTYDQWVDFSGQVLSSWILIWNFQDLLHPELILEVPGDLYTFRFHPQNPNLICGGLMTGQVITWDLTKVYEELAQKSANPSQKQEQRKMANVIDDDEHEELPPVKPVAISYVDRSHSRPVVDVFWTPPDQQINKRKELYATQETPTQFVSAAGDGTLIWWDSRVHLTKVQHVGKYESQDTKEIKWLPLFQCHVWNPLTPEAIGALPITRLRPMFDVAGGTAAEGDFSYLVGSEDGQLAMLDWSRARPKEGQQQASGEEKQKIEVVTNILSGHYQNVRSIQRSPHFDDILLTCGDWRFIIWKIGLDQPLFESPSASEFVHTAIWSPTRPGLIITGKSDGTLDIWDLLDQCHKPSYTFSSGNEPIVSMEFWSGNDALQYLAVGDQSGKLHIIDMPRALRRQNINEKGLMQEFYEREMRRVEYFNDREKAHEKERARLEKEQERLAAQAAKEAKQHAKENRGVLFDDESDNEQDAAINEMEEQLRKEEAAYQEMLSAFREDLLADQKEEEEAAPSK